MAAHNAVGIEAKAEQRKRVWDMYCSGMSKYRIAKIIGCTEGNIGQMIKRLVGKSHPVGMLVT